MKHALLVALLAAACGQSRPSPPPRPEALLAPAAGSGSVSCAAPVVIHTLAAADGVAVRGALTELGGRLYGLAGERGPNGTPDCSSSANWQTVEHTQHCPGSLFSLATDGSDFRVEHAFSPLDAAARNADGYHPYGTLAAGPDGRLYGVTQMGGAPSIAGTPIPGFGVAFAFDPRAGALEVIHTFFAVDRALDGEYPMGALAVDATGNVYGTTKGGGASSAGTVWEWSPGGAFRYAPLPGEGYGGVALAGGLLHGTTWAGGLGAGVYYTVDTATLAVTVVDQFPAFTANAHGTDNTPIQEPTALSNGAVVAAREFGGAAGTGLIASLDRRAGIRVLREVDDIPLEASPRFANATGGMLNGRIAEGRNGLLYGSAQYGGAAGTGGIYELARDGTRYRLLWSWPDGAFPYGGVTLGSDGALYGTTFNTGRIWRLDPAGCP